MKEELFRRGLAVALINLEHEPELDVLQAVHGASSAIATRTESALYVPASAGGPPAALTLRNQPGSSRLAVARGRRSANQKPQG
jgi:hypothetical protein